MTLSFAACSTVAGVGKDIQDSANWTKEKMGGSKWKNSYSSFSFSIFNFQLSPGIYFVKVSDGEKVYTEKLLID